MGISCTAVNTRQSCHSLSAPDVAATRPLRHPLPTGPRFRRVSAGEVVVCLSEHFLLLTTSIQMLAQESSSTIRHSGGARNHCST
jgi:hypothetical protein